MSLLFLCVCELCCTTYCAAEKNGTVHLYTVDFGATASSSLSVVERLAGVSPFYYMLDSASHRKNRIMARSTPKRLALLTGDLFKAGS